MEVQSRLQHFYGHRRGEGDAVHVLYCHALVPNTRLACAHVAHIMHIMPLMHAAKALHMPSRHVAAACMYAHGRGRSIAQLEE